MGQVLLLLVSSVDYQAMTYLGWSLSHIIPVWKLGSPRLRETYSAVAVQIGRTACYMTPVCLTRKRMLFQRFHSPTPCRLCCHHRELCVLLCTCLGGWRRESSEGIVTGDQVLPQSDDFRELAGLKSVYVRVGSLPFTMSPALLVGGGCPFTAGPEQ